MKRFDNNDDALPAILIILLAAAFCMQATHHKRHVEADQIIIAAQAAQLSNLRAMLQIATEPVDKRAQSGRKIR